MAKNESRFISRDLLKEQNPAILGVAKDLDSNDFLYKEFHYMLESGRRHIVIYRNSEDFIIAEKELRYRTGQLDTKPKLLQNNYLSGERISVVESISESDITVSFRESQDSRVEEKIIDDHKTLVVDAGFNQFIIHAWPSLMKGEKIRFEYLSPSQKKTFTFSVEREACDDERLGNVPQECFSIAPKSWLLRQLVKPISLVYESSPKRLIRFSGLGNIGDEDGDYMKVDIRYEYAEDVDAL